MENIRGVSIKGVAIANRIIERSLAYNEYCRANGLQTVHIYGTRLQKLMYFCQLYSYASENKPLFEDNFKAWPKGPTIAELYNIFMVYQDYDMRPLLSKEFTKYGYKLKESEKKIINYVVDSLINVSTESLVDVTQEKSGPWFKYYDRLKINYSIIPKEEIKKYADEIVIFYKNDKEHFAKEIHSAKKLLKK